MLEPILKGLVEWIYEMMVDIMAYASSELLGVMSMDLQYFRETAPVIDDIVNVFISLGWALLIGNLVFQMLKAMMSAAGFEAEDPKIVFLRTFVFSFLLLASRQICDIGLTITGTVIDLLELPSSINVVTPNESMFSLGAGAKWLLVIIVGVVLMIQMVKLLFEIGERYVITSVLTFFAPLAFAMGGSRNTNDIFKGWCRMYGSMLVMMIMNIVFLKLIMSAMSQMSSGGVLIWLVFVVALTRVARKIDSHIGKIGLNPAQTGSELGSRIPGVMTMIAVKTMGSIIGKSMGGGGGKGTSGRNGSPGGRPSAPPPGGRGGNGGSGGSERTASGGRSSSSNASSSTSTHTASSGRTHTSHSAENTTVTTQGNVRSTGSPAQSSRAPQGRGSGSVNNSVANGGAHNSTAIGTPAKANSTPRPPIPRNTSRTASGAPTTANNMSMSSSAGDTAVTGNHSDARSAAHNTGTMLGGSVRTSHTDAPSIRSSSVSGGSHTRAESASSERISERYSAERSSVHERHGYIQVPGRSTAPQQSIKHEYRDGKYNPAAVNKKVKRTVYKKETEVPRFSQRRSRRTFGGEHNGKREQKQ